MAIKAVLFDLDNTLFNSRGLTRTARWEACEAMVNAGLPANSTKEVYERLKAIVKKYGSNYPGHFDRLCESYGVRKEPEIVMSGRVAYHNAKFALINPYPNTEKVLMRLVRAGLCLGIVTNGLMEKQWEKILRLKIRHFFDVIVISGREETQSGKQATIRKALKKLKVKPENAAFVGDSPKSDIASAKALGLTTILFLSPSVSKPGKPASAKERPHLTIHHIEELPDVLGI